MKDNQENNEEDKKVSFVADGATAFALNIFGWLFTLGFLNQLNSPEWIEKFIVGFFIWPYYLGEALRVVPH